MAEQKKTATVSIPGVGDYEVPLEANPEPRSLGGRAVDLLTNPEILSGAASFIPGVGTGTAGAIGAGASLVNDYRHGDTDPFSMAGRATLHGGLSMIPGGVGKILERGMPAAAEAGLSVMSGGSKLGMAARALKALGLGGTEAAAPAVSDLAGATLPGGIKVLSQDGLKMLVQKSVDLENAGAPKQTIAALDQLIARVRGEIPAPTAGTVLSRAGMQLTSAADAASQAAQARAGQIANRLRALLGAASATTDQVSR